MVTLTNQNEALEVEVEGLKSAAKGHQEKEQLLSEANARLEVQKSELEEKITELEASGKIALEASNDRQIEYNNLIQEKVQESLDRSANDYQQQISKLEEEHADFVSQIRSQQQEKVDQAISACHKEYQH